MSFSIETKLREMSNSENYGKLATRISAVHSAQRQLGMEPRDDSRLTYMYACGHEMQGQPPSTVAHELTIVNKIYQNTRYSYIIEDVMRELAKYIRKKYRLTWTNTWDIVQFYGPILIKLYSVKLHDLEL